MSTYIELISWCLQRKMYETVKLTLAKEGKLKETNETFLLIYCKINFVFASIAFCWIAFVLLLSHVHLLTWTFIHLLCHATRVMRRTHFTPSVKNESTVYSLYKTNQKHNSTIQVILRQLENNKWPKHIPDSCNMQNCSCVHCIP